MSTPQMMVFGGKRGRLPRAEAAAQPFRVRLSPAELERVKEAARVNRQNPADFARDALVTAADDCLEPKRRNS